MQGAGIGPCVCKVLRGHWCRVPEDAGCWHRVPAGTVSLRMLAQGP